jgi:hypothetical protein
MERRVMQVLSFAILGLVVLGTWWTASWAHESQFEDVAVPFHRITYHSLGFHDQDDVIRAKVVVDEGSVKVLEGRVAIVQLVDSGNKASLELGEGYETLRSVTIDTKETDVGDLEYTAHRADTYYIVYRNEDWWNLTLKVADGDALQTQLLIKALATGLFATTVICFLWFYGRLFDVDIREKLGFVRRPRGPGSMSAR